MPSTDNEPHRPQTTARRPRTTLTASHEQQQAPTDKWQAHTADNDPPLLDDERPQSTTTAQHPIPSPSIPPPPSLPFPSITLHPSLPSASLPPLSLHHSIPPSPLHNSLHHSPPLPPPSL
ncbi:hypothetical protein K443DRAFT_3860 [Laccaria amethystina LaAM-08-1]|uniref:Uncharacterized protein n=1 Tax=Laccaria amethystina LaAM-08-1 TaxID=1095629 RepID=A0A0C9YB84_9AGAR|nr:hypothetical protein K443DRAFT_3860 [Laccaria amethystina LaAM-08-1]